MANITTYRVTVRRSSFLWCLWYYLTTSYNLLLGALLGLFGLILTGQLFVRQWLLSVLLDGLGLQKLCHKGCSDWFRWASSEFAAFFSRALGGTVLK